MTTRPVFERDFIPSSFVLESWRIPLRWRKILFGEKPRIHILIFYNALYDCIIEQFAVPNVLMWQRTALSRSLQDVISFTFFFVVSCVWLTSLSPYYPGITSQTLDVVWTSNVLDLASTLNSSTTLLARGCRLSSYFVLCLPLARVPSRFPVKYNFPRYVDSRNVNKQTFYCVCAKNRCETVFLIFNELLQWV